ncbi:MAG: amino acid ABC transporter permease [Chthoniobacterales bacterium]|nr:amino acid ABC transporter permease [Chthoniobacterales bacterium]
MTRRHHAINLAISIALGATLLSAASFAVLQAASWNWSSVWKYREVFWKGWITTIWISAAALVLSVLLGLFAALGRRSPYPALRWLSAGYVELIRGTPLLVQLLILFYVVADAVGLQNRYTAGILILSIFSGAYIAEMIRAGIESVGKSQLESARAIGLTRWQTYRHVIFPQAIRQVIPPLAGQAASIIKDSSLLSILGIEEFTLAAQQVNSATYSTLESYLPLAAGYLVLTLPISIFARRLERKFRYET